MEDQSNPFLIHPSNHPNLTLVSQPLIDFVDGSIPPPPENDPLYRTWLHNNNIVASWLLNSITQEISASVIQSSTATALWQDLVVLFRQENGPRLLQLKRNLASCVQGSLSVTKYFTKVKTLWEDLGEYKPTHHCQCGGVRPLLDFFHEEYVLTFLMGLNENFQPH